MATAAAENHPPASPDSDVEEPTTFAGTFRVFGTADPRTLGLFRVCFGVTLLVDLYRRLADVTLFFTNDGVLPNHSAIYRPMSVHLFSIFHVFSSRSEVLVSFALSALVYALYTIGWRTNVMKWLVLLVVSSLHSRNILLENGGDVVANLLALWTAFLPVGARFSVDAMSASMRAHRETSVDELNARGFPEPDRTPTVSLAYAAFVVNLAFIYYFNCIHKDGAPWRELTTVHYVLWADRLIQPLGVFVRGWLPPVAIYVMTFSTLVMEASLAVFLLSPIWIRSCRRVAALLILALHCGFQTVGHFGMFTFVMVLNAPLLMGPEDWTALARRWKTRLPKRVVYYDSDCGVCHLCARFLMRLDHLQRLRMVSNDDTDALPPGITPAIVQDTIVVSDEAGLRTWTRAAAIAEICRSLPFGEVIASLIDAPGLRALANAGYDYFAAHRHEVSEALGYGVCGIHRKSEAAAATFVVPPKAPFFPRARKIFVNGVIALFVVSEASEVIAENPRKLPPWLKLKEQPQLLAAVAQYPRLFQGWSMFAPIPPFDDGKLVIDGVTVDGRHLDPLAGGTAVDLTMPPENEALLMTQFYYELHDRMRREANARYRDHLRDWIFNWQKLEGRPASDRIVSFDMYWVARTTQPPFDRERLDDTKAQKIMSASAPTEPASADGASTATPAESAAPPASSPRRPILRLPPK